jgi:hypothetical protein
MVSCVVKNEVNVSVLVCVCVSRVMRNDEDDDEEAATQVARQTRLTACVFCAKTVLSLQKRVLMLAELCAVSHSCTLFALSRNQGLHAWATRSE